MKSMAAFYFMTLLATPTFAQSSFEVMCRAKAKEIAIQTYSGCVNEARKSQLEDIRSNYKKDLADLKAKYDKRLKKLSGKESTADVAQAAPAPAAEPVTSLPEKDDTIEVIDMPVE